MLITKLWGFDLRTPYGLIAVHDVSPSYSQLATFMALLAHVSRALTTKSLLSEATASLDVVLADFGHKHSFDRAQA